MNKIDIKKFALSALILNFGVLLGRFSGFIRELTVANNYGVSYQADLTIIALTLPDILINILVGGALSAALIPLMTRHPENARKITFQASLALLSLFLFFAFLLQPISNLVVTAIAPGLIREVSLQAQEIVSLTFYILPVFVITGVLTSYLHSKEQFAVPSLGTLIFNSVVIAFLTYLDGVDYSLSMIITAVFCAGFARYLSQLIAVKPTFRFSGMLSPWLIDRTLLKKYIQAMLAGGAFFLFPVVTRSFSSYYGEGSIASFSYAMRLIEFPLLISVTFISVIFFPKLSKSFSRDRDKFESQLSVALHSILVLGLFSTIVLTSITNRYVEIVFGIVLDSSLTNQILPLVRIGLLCLVFQGIITVLTAALNAANKPKIPMVLNFIVIILLILIFNLKGSHARITDLMWYLVSAYIFLCSLYFYKCRQWIMGKLINRNLMLFYFNLIFFCGVISYLGVNFISNSNSILFLVLYLIASLFTILTVSFLSYPLGRKIVTMRVRNNV